MRHSVRLLLLVTLLTSSVLFAVPAGAAGLPLPVPGPCQDGVLPSGALSRICIPTANWNGDLVVYAHGYTAFNAPLDLQHLELPNGAYLPDLVQNLGFAFAATNYRRNGLVIPDGAADIRELVAAFPGVAGRAPDHTYITGVSEGGIIAALLVEQSPELFSGGLSLCGPVGSSKQQVDYWGDFRLLFDYFFPAALPPGPFNIPQALIDGWEGFYKPVVEARVAADPAAARQLIRTSKAAVALTNPTTTVQTIDNLLWYNIYATNDAIAQFGGNPFDNTNHVYLGSRNDWQLNRDIPRYPPNPGALGALGPYETSGRVTIPLVTLHTTSDEIVPFWHQLLYRAKLRAAGSTAVIQIPIPRYGHCNFTTAEVLGGFGLLVLEVTGKHPEDIQQLFTPDQAQRDFGQAERDAERAESER